ncbi:MAG: type II secretion system protein [Deltaproteobacteria bacterium]|nr:type II secretion system protein [Deltaproteobacteria bacterium]
MRGNRGFTLIELVLVITILGILAVSAMPNFINVATQARQSSRDGVVGAVRAGIALFRANDLVVNGPPGNYPAALDAVANGTVCSAAAPCFGNVVTNGITSGSWTKATATTWTFNDGTTTFTYTYASAAGTFTSPTAP